jgi:hypothetical protein
VRRLIERFSWLTAVALVAGFVYLTAVLSDPVDRVQKDVLIRGTIRPAPELRQDAPFIRYAAVHAGNPTVDDALVQSPVDDTQTSPAGGFELVAGERDGSRFLLLARIETAREELWCETVELPPVRHRDDGTWVEQATDRPLEPVEVTVDRGERCG